jgi:hypothetical protein
MPKLSAKGGCKSTGLSDLAQTRPTRYARARITNYTIILLPMVCCCNKSNAATPEVATLGLRSCGEEVPSPRTPRMLLSRRSTLPSRSSPLLSTGALPLNPQCRIPHYDLTCGGCKSQAMQSQQATHLQGQHLRVGHRQRNTIHGSILASKTRLWPQKKTRQR